MNKEQITENDCIHVKTQFEYHRIIKLFGMDDEYFMNYFYGSDTVLYPLKNQYGSVDGVCV